VRLRPHFFPFTEPSVEVDGVVLRRPCGTERRCPVCKGTGWLEILGAGMVDPNVYGYVREHGYDPEQVQGFAFGMASSGSRCSSTAIPDLRLFLRQRPALPEAVRMRLPLEWLHDYVAAQT